MAPVPNERLPYCTVTTRGHLLSLGAIHRTLCIFLKKCKVFADRKTGKEEKMTPQFSSCPIRECFALLIKMQGIL